MTSKKKTALITGATSGIGLELAKLFVIDNFDLVIVARDQGKLDLTANELIRNGSVTIHTIAKDLFVKESPAEIYQHVKSLGLNIDILVNNAGQGEYGEFINTDIERELDIIQLNIASTVMLTKLFLKDMLMQNEGRILNVGSIAGEAPGPWQSVYHGTKAFIHSWSAALRNELKDTGITITVLVPGATDTDFFNKADMEDSKILETDLASPEKVAEDGYKALMNGEEKIVSGMKNKVQVAMARVMTDSKAADTMDKQQKPSE